MLSADDDGGTEQMPAPTGKVDPLAALLASPADPTIVDVAAVTGLDPADLDLYRCLLHDSPQVVQRLRTSLGMTQEEVVDRLTRLIAAGFVVRVPERRGFAAISPEVTVTTATLRRELQLMTELDRILRLHIAAPGLTDLFGRPKLAQPDGPILLVYGSEAVGGAETDVLRAARTDLRRIGPLLDAGQKPFSSRVRHRAIYSAQYAQQKDHRRQLLAESTDGVAIRLRPRGVGVSIVLADARIGFLALGAGQRRVGLLVRPSTVLALLVEMWDSFWDSARPFPAPVHSPAKRVRHLLTNRELTVLRLMAQGLKAEAIARHLGVSVRTLARYMEVLYDKFDASSSAELMWVAATQGLVDSASV